MQASKAGDEDLQAEGACEAWRKRWSGEKGEMAHQEDAAALAALGEQLFNASFDGEAAGGPPFGLERPGQPQSGGGSVDAAHDSCSRRAR